MFPSTAVVFSGISLTTTQFAPILQLLPIVTFPIIFAPAPIKTLSPMWGEPYLGCPLIVLDPIVTD